MEATGESLSTIRRHGRQINPGAAWDDIDGLSEVLVCDALGICLVHHLTRRHVLETADALSAALVLRESVTRYAAALLTAWKPDVPHTKLPVMMVEVAEERWVRVQSQIFDLQEQTSVSSTPLIPYFSHAVSMLGLFLRMRPMENGHALGFDAETESQSSAAE